MIRGVIIRNNEGMTNLGLTQHNNRRAVRVIRLIWVITVVPSVDDRA